MRNAALIALLFLTACSDIVVYDGDSGHPMMGGDTGLPMEMDAMVSADTGLPVVEMDSGVEMDAGPRECTTQESAQACLPLLRDAHSGLVGSCSQYLNSCGNECVAFIGCQCDGLECLPGGTENPWECHLSERMNNAAFRINGESFDVFDRIRSGPELNHTTPFGRHHIEDPDARLEVQEQAAEEGMFMTGHWGIERGLDSTDTEGNWEFYGVRRLGCTENARTLFYQVKVQHLASVPPERALSGCLGDTGMATSCELYVRTQVIAHIYDPATGIRNAVDFNAPQARLSYIRPTDRGVVIQLESDGWLAGRDAAFKLTMESDYLHRI